MENEEIPTHEIKKQVKNRWKVIEVLTIFFKNNWKFLIGVLFLGLITNQAVQPIFSPRISNFEITPLYLQGLENYNENGSYTGTEYYLISKLAYNIETPLFPVSKKLVIELPKNFQFNQIYLLGGYIKNNPYIQLPSLLKDHSPSFIPRDDFGGKITLKILPTARSVRSLNQDIFIAEKTDILKKSLVGEDYYWYSYLNTFPLETPEVGRWGYHLGYVSTTNYPNKIYQVYEHIIRNNGNLEIRGYDFDFSEKILICEGDIERITFESDEKSYISFRLSPKETKRIISLTRYDENLTEEEKGKKQIIPDLMCNEISKIFYSKD